MFRTGQMFGVGYIESVLLGQSSERSLMNGHEKLSVFGIVDGEEAALLKPVARALLLRDALRANAHGGLEFGPGAKAILKGEAELSARSSRPSASGGARARGERRRQSDRRSAVRGAARQAPRARDGSAGCRLM